MNKKKLTKIGKGSLIAALGAILAYLANVDFTNEGPIWGAIFATVVNAGYQFLRKESGDTDGK